MTPTTTSAFHERLVSCDISDLQNVPPFPHQELIPLKGKSSAQVTFAATIRTKKMKEWEHDLPDSIVQALKGIADATWWLSNKDRDSSNIGWPQSWLHVSERNLMQPELGQPASLDESRAKALNGKFETPSPESSDKEMEEFEKFARKACLSPELSYLAMMALIYRQTKSEFALNKFNEARSRVAAHLDAIDTIAGVYPL